MERKTDLRAGFLLFTRASQLNSPFGSSSLSLHQSYQTMLSIRSLLLLRIIPVFLMVGSSFILPWIAKTYLITGLSGLNFKQTDVSQCEVLHRDTLMGCEDLHVYNAPSGPMIFTGCVEKISDQYVFSRNQVRGPLIGDLVSGDYC